MENVICFTIGRSGFPEGTRRIGTFNFANHPNWKKDFSGDEKSYVAHATCSYQHFERWLTSQEVELYKSGHYNSVELGRNVPRDLK